MKKIIMLFCFVLTACGGSVDNNTINKAQQLCSNNGGIKFLYSRPLDYADVWCNNGANFERFMKN